MARSAVLFALVGLLSACGKSDTEQGFDRLAGTDHEHGERLSRVLGCTGCHEANLHGKDWSQPGFATMHSGNVTRSFEKFGRDGMRMVLTQGRTPEGRELWEMPSFLFVQLKPADIDSLLDHLSSLEPAGDTHAPPVFLDGAREEQAAGLYISSATEVKRKGLDQGPDAGPEHGRARYIVRTTCAECHGVDLRGGIPYPGAKPRPDLRGAAGYSLPEFNTLLIEGKALGGQPLGQMKRPALNRYRYLTPRERSEIHAYLVELAQRDP